mmetsp:Transcript_12256/g.34680  ORF Transcript_12256/g.34680 Transcript_12256/m.34680 type:complete len:344 (+) Transcript_12256:575-1606(+)
MREGPSHTLIMAAPKREAPLPWSPARATFSEASTRAFVAAVASHSSSASPRISALIFCSSTLTSSAGIFASFPPRQSNAMVSKCSRSSMMRNSLILPRAKRSMRVAECSCAKASCSAPGFSSAHPSIAACIASTSRFASASLTAPTMSHRGPSRFIGASRWMRQVLSFHSITSAVSVLRLAIASCACWKRCLTVATSPRALATSFSSTPCSSAAFVVSSRFLTGIDLAPIAASNRMVCTRRFNSLPAPLIAFSVVKLRSRCRAVIQRSHASSPTLTSSSRLTALSSAFHRCSFRRFSASSTLVCRFCRSDSAFRMSAKSGSDHASQVASSGRLQKLSSSVSSV